MTNRAVVLSEPNKTVPASTPSKPQMVAVTVQVPPEPKDYAGMAINGGIGVMGGVIGALVGAWAAYHFGLKASREAINRAESARDRQLRFSVVQKLNKIYSAQKEIRITCDEAVHRLAAAKERAAREGLNFLDHLSMELRPFATSLIRLSFSPDEVAQVGKGGDLEALAIMMMLDDRHNTTAALLDEFRGLKAEFEAVAHRDGDFDPNRGYMQFRWSPEEYAKYRPYLFKMDSLTTAIHKHSALDEQDAYKATLAVAKATAKADGPKVDIRITAPDGRIARVTPGGVELFNAGEVPPLVTS